MPGKILYLSWSVPPDTSGSAIIALNLLQQFTREEMVVAGEKPCGKPPVQWKPGWPELCYVQSVWPVTGRGLRWWRLLQFPLLLWRCLRIIRRHRVDRIVAVYPKTQFLLAGYLAARLTGCKLFAYLHNTYDGLAGINFHFSSWVHELVFRRAEHVFVMSRGMSELFERRFPGVRQSPLVHSFNEPIPEFQGPPAVGSPMRLIFCGNLTSCADAASRLAEAIAGTPNASLAILSGDDPARLRELGLMRPGTTCETVSRDEIPRRLRQADIVLLPHSFAFPPRARDDFLTIFPTKTIEYLFCGRPILAHTPADCFLTRFLLENDCALVVDRPDVDALTGSIQRLRNDAALRQRLVCNALKTAEQFLACNVAAEFRKRVGGTGTEVDGNNRTSSEGAAA
jgi:glycosyltransferase involved in cell wall biosynthesis